MHNRSTNPILLTHEVATLDHVYQALARTVWPADRPAPVNLDGLADLLRETGIRKVIACHWALDDDDTRRVGRVFRDLGVELVR